MITHLKTINGMDEFTHSQVEFIKTLPETSMGYHRLKIYMQDGETHELDVFNSAFFKSNKNIDVNRIASIKRIK